MVKINNSFIKKISQSELALFVFLIMALGNLLTFLDNNDLGGIILFFIIGFLIMMKNKNMVIILGLTMILTNITILILKSLNVNLNSVVGKEGLEGIKEGVNKKKKKKLDNNKISSAEEMSNVAGIAKSQIDPDTIKHVKNLTTTGVTSKDNLKNAEEALTKLEPLMDRAEGLMKMYNKMGGGALLEGILKGSDKGEEEEE